MAWVEAGVWFLLGWCIGQAWRARMPWPELMGIVLACSLFAIVGYTLYRLVDMLFGLVAYG